MKRIAPRSLRHRFAQAFSLMEVMVVVAILAVLAVLAFPALRSGTESARAAHCMANLQQIGVGMSLYLGDHDQQFPPAYTGQYHWYQAGLPDQLGYYLGHTYFKGDYWKGSILNCPSKDGGYLGKSINYTYNYSLPLLYIKPYAVASPARTIAFGENFSYSENPDTFFFFGRWTRYDPGNTGIDWNSHRGASNVLFVDGHVEAVSGKDQSDRSVIIYDPRQE